METKTDQVNESQDLSSEPLLSPRPAPDKTWQRKNGYSAFRCPYCGKMRETQWRRAEEWFVCPDGHEDEDVYRRQDELP